MKKMAIWVTLFVLILGLAGCGVENEAPLPVQQSIQAAAAKEWTVQEINSMFDSAKKQNWEFVDSLLIADHASGRVGAVLFWDDEKETSNVAFFDGEGFYQQSGIYGKTAEDPAFSYLGNGTVTFQIIADDGITYMCSLSIEIEGADVNFTVGMTPA